MKINEKGWQLVPINRFILMINDQWILYAFVITNAHWLSIPSNQCQEKKNGWTAMYVPVLLRKSQTNKQQAGSRHFKLQAQDSEQFIHLSNSSKILIKLQELWIQLVFAVFMKLCYLENIVCENSYYDAAPVKVSNMYCKWFAVSSITCCK